MRRLYEQISTQALEMHLPNFSNQDDGDITAGIGAENAERIVALRRRYDPAGTFAVNVVS